MTSTDGPQQLINSIPALKLGLSVLSLIGLLLVVAGVLVATVLVSSRQSLGIWPRIKASLAVLIWVVPAMTVVGLIAARSERNFTSPSTNSTVVAQAVSLATAERVPAIEAEATNARERLAARGSAVPAMAAKASIATNELSELARGEPRLKVRSTSSDDPQWNAKPRFVNGREVMCLSSQRFATLPLAEEHITSEALKQVKQHYQGEFPLSGDWQVPVSAVDHYGVKDLVGEVIDKDFGNGISAKMYRAHLQLDYSPELSDAIHESWRGQIVNHRLLILGSMLGLVTLMLSSAAGYFRLDELTGGAYRRRLKLAATAVIAAGSIVVAQVVS
ncbi:MAG: hypothetical protein EXS05_05695 [Planctomycetaceae bacterium]|nr:hypothetical protein [Planctomycetaceae bacterium]